MAASPLDDLYLLIAEKYDPLTPNIVSDGFGCKMMKWDKHS